MRAAVTWPRWTVLTNWGREAGPRGAETSCMSGDRVFVDTNVLVYAHDASAGSKRDRAQSIIRSLWESGDGCLSIQVLQEFFVAVTRKVPQPLEIHKARALVAELSQWHVHLPGTDGLPATDLHRRQSVSFWDSMIIRSAAKLGCVKLFSEDLADGEKFDGSDGTQPLLGALTGTRARRQEKPCETYELASRPARRAASAPPETVSGTRGGQELGEPAAASARRDPDPAGRASLRDSDQTTVACSRRQPRIPDRNHRVRAEPQGRREVDGISSPQTLLASQSPGMTAQCLREFDDPHARPIPLPLPQSDAFCGGVKTMVPRGRRDRSSDLGIRETTRDRSVAPVPEFGGELTAFLLDDQLDEGTAVEIDNRHGTFSAAAPTRNPIPSHRRGPVWRHVLLAADRGVSTTLAVQSVTR